MFGFDTTLIPVSVGDSGSTYSSPLLTTIVTVSFWLQEVPAAGVCLITYPLLTVELDS